jgi:hypothetical protein
MGMWRVAWEDPHLREWKRYWVGRKLVSEEAATPIGYDQWKTSLGVLA